MWEQKGNLTRGSEAAADEGRKGNEFTQEEEKDQMATDWGVFEMFTCSS